MALRRKFNLLISLDLLRPLLSISLIILAWYNEYNVEIELYVLSMALSMCIETLIIIPFVINSYRILPSSPHTFKALASSGFSVRFFVFKYFDKKVTGYHSWIVTTRINCVNVNIYAVFYINELYNFNIDDANKPKSVKKRNFQ